MKRSVGRRAFLGRISVGAALGSCSWSELLGHARVPGTTLTPGSLGRGEEDDEPYWGRVRDQFAFSEDRVPMNAANLCPSPRSVADRVEELTRDIDRDCSFDNRAKFAELTERSRRHVAAGLGVEADEIALVRNTSEANNVINNGVPLGPGDEVVLWDENHPTNNVAWDVRAARYGIVVRRVSVPTGATAPEELMEPFLRAVNDRTRVLTVTHVSNVTGVRLPVRALADAVAVRGIHVHVDGAQCWGALDVRIPELGCDSYAASTHKWFMGPKEAGILYVRRGRVDDIWPSVVAPGWGSDAEADLVGARKFESLGQRDDACLAAVQTAAALHEAIGPDRRWARIAYLVGALKEGVRELGFELVTPMEETLSGGVCVIRAPGDRPAALSRLYAEHGVAGAPTGGLRLCPHIYNTMEHVHRALRGIDALRGVLLG